MNAKNYSIKFSLIFWLSYFTYEFLTAGTFSNHYFAAFIKACVNVPLAFLISYVSLHILFEKYYLNNKKVIFNIGIIVLAIVSITLKRAIYFYYIYPYLEPHPFPTPFFFFPKFVYEFFNLYFIVFLYGMFYFIRVWNSQQQLLKDLKQEKTHAELELLKSQVQPHFIFNTLNGIYAEAFKKTPKVANQIIKLSDLLEYTLYDSKKENVALIDELKYIQNYLDLQKIRFGDKVDISINVYDDISHIQIPPLLILPIIENCFKHGINNSIKNSWMRIDISTKTNELTIKVENSIEEGSEDVKRSNGGLGLENVIRRLALIYPNKHEINMYKEANSFLVVLKIITE
ncbi:sensor histidine kinase [Aquirufa ecclesiirivi]|uniref:Sensor histidine kinase n=1 Tax=Aquirufa ecclesiirivi TaxID=2715124 RepID=A0ABT4JF42_9BACT|nr:histidine kinase [Aquirufa ecclesiirivi]MCZ2474548.1 sensor histidine kinase [Aquirufa ecclesiirivi]